MVDEREIVEVDWTDKYLGPGKADKMGSKSVEKKALYLAL